MKIRAKQRRMLEIARQGSRAEISEEFAARSRGLNPFGELYFQIDLRTRTETERQRETERERERERGGGATENAIIRALSVSKVTSSRAGAGREAARGLPGSRLWAARVGLIGNFTARR